MEYWDVEYPDGSCPASFPWIRIIGAGKTGANALSCFASDEFANGGFLKTLSVGDKEDFFPSQAEILNFISDDAEWLFVITDIEDLSIAEKVIECLEELDLLTKVIKRREALYLLTTFVILCPSAEDARLSDIPANFGTWIILPEDKIAETDLTNNEMIYLAVDMTTNIIPLMKKGNNIFGMGLDIVAPILANMGRSYVGFGKSLEIEGATLKSAKKALKSPLLIEEISKSKNALLVFVGNCESLSCLEANEAANMLFNEMREVCCPECEGGLLQVVLDDNSDGVTAFVLVTNFKK